MTLENNEQYFYILLSGSQNRVSNWLKMKDTSDPHRYYFNLENNWSEIVIDMWSMIPAC